MNSEVKAKLPEGGPISASELYTVEQFKKRLRLTESAFRSLRRAGLPVIRYGKRAFILGQKAIQFFTTLSERDESQSR